MKIKTAQAEGVARSLAELTLRAAAPNISDAERAAASRTAGGELADLRDLVRVAGVLPSRIVDTLAAADGDTAAEERLRARAVIDEVRAVASELPSDISGLIARPELIPGLPTGLGEGVPLIRTLATSWAGNGLPMIPSAPSGDLTGEIVPPGTAPSGSGGFTIADIVTPRFTMAAAYGTVARQVFDWTSDPAGRWLDQIYLDIADRAAEVNIGAAIIAAGVTTAVIDNDLHSALIAAECLAGSALNAPADLVLVNPLDLPRVRMSVADHWLVDPHPTLVCSMGIPAGKVVTTGRSAFVLLARPIAIGTVGAADRLDDSVMSAVDPSGWSVTVAVMRNFLLSVRNPAAIRVITL